jgi:hypothetical protein
MSHKPMVYSEKPIKTRTLDRMHKSAQDAVSKPKPIDTGQYEKLDRRGLKKG